MLESDPEPFCELDESEPLEDEEEPLPDLEVVEVDVLALVPDLAFDEVAEVPLPFVVDLLLFDVDDELDAVGLELEEPDLDVRSELPVLLPIDDEPDDPDVLSDRLPDD